VISGWAGVAEGEAIAGGRGVDATSGADGSEIGVGLLGAEPASRGG
jgi:hypothetical protein